MRSRRRRVLYVQRPRGGGSATGLYDLLRCLDKEHIEPVVLFYEHNRYCSRFSELGATVHVLSDRQQPSTEQLTNGVPKSLRGAISRLVRSSNALKQTNRFVRRDVPTARKIAALIQSQAIDLVHNNDNPRGDRASMLAARLAGVPQVSHVRFLPEYFRPIDRYLARLVESFIYMSKAIEKHYRKEVGVSANRGQVIYDPIDFARFGSGDDSVAPLRSSYGIGSGERLVTNVGRIVPWKGHDVFLHAIASVASTRPEVRALIVGAPNPNRAGVEYEATLRELADRLGIADRVTFTGFREDIPEILAASDVVVHSASMPEPFGRIVVEAMAAGRPVVATAAGGVQEIIENGETGLLVPTRDAGRMAIAVEELLGSPETAAKMGASAKRSVSSRFAPERFTQALHEVYERIFQSRLPGAELPSASQP